VIARFWAAWTAASLTNCSSAREVSAAGAPENVSNVPNKPRRMTVAGETAQKISTGVDTPAIARYGLSRRGRPPHHTHTDLFSGCSPPPKTHTSRAATGPVVPQPRVLFFWLAHAVFCLSCDASAVISPASTKPPCEGSVHPYNAKVGSIAPHIIRRSRVSRTWLREGRIDSRRGRSAVGKDGSMW
jgi:hypothetical protein